ncbi:MAG: N(4)-(beta-N-acetylglucosaminyl)-L-asparaginase [Candidatus Latescibacterota bacterium]
MTAESGAGPVVAATWGFGPACVRAGLAALAAGGTALDAVEQGAWEAEADPAVHTVGLGGTPNRDGVVQVDAAVMWGPGHRAGSVAALEGILHPVSVARRVMEIGEHVMLVGEGARRFALAEGFPATELLTSEARQRWEDWRRQRQTVPGHDTVGVVALDAAGNLAASCSTSGLAFKHQGRVGDSPVIGSGLYVDNAVGAVAATGRGEEIMRHCASYAVVAAMADGLPPEQACLEVLRQMAARDPKGTSMEVALVAVDRQGRAAGAGMRRGFPYAWGRDQEVQTAAGAYLVE